MQKARLGMGSNKKGRSGVPAPKRPTNKDMVTPPDFRSQKDCSIFPTREQGQVEKLLRPGHENAISTRVLVDMVGCGSARQLQTLIAAERARGALILSSAAGIISRPPARRGVRSCDGSSIHSEQGRLVRCGQCNTQESHLMFWRGSLR